MNIEFILDNDEEDGESGEIISGYNILFLISIISIAYAILIKKRERLTLNPPQIKAVIGNRQIIYVSPPFPDTW